MQLVHLLTGLSVDCVSASGESFVGLGMAPAMGSVGRGVLWAIWEGWVLRAPVVAEREGGKLGVEGAACPPSSASIWLQNRMIADTGGMMGRWC